MWEFFRCGCFFFRAVFFYGSFLFALSQIHCQFCFDFHSVIQRRRGSRLSLPCILTTGWAIDRSWPGEPSCWSPYSANGYKFVTEATPSTKSSYTTDIDKETVSSLRFIHVLRCEFYHIWIHVQMKIRYDDQTVSCLVRFLFNNVFFMSYL